MLTRVSGSYNHIALCNHHIRRKEGKHVSTAVLQGDKCRGPDGVQRARGVRAGTAEVIPDWKMFLKPSRPFWPINADFSTNSLEGTIAQEHDKSTGTLLVRPGEIGQIGHFNAGINNSVHSTQRHRRHRCSVWKLIDHLSIGLHPSR